jgi:hypothetical protein
MKVNPESQGGLVGGGDYEGQLHRDDVVKTFHTREASAVGAAQRAAVKNPGHQYAVMGIIKIFETTKPTFIEKALNDAGEIVVVKGTS